MDPGACWPWPGRIDKHGYGRCKVGKKAMLAHRAVYEALIGEIPTGLTLDHLCRNRSCCNPRHLDPCTGGENTLRSPETLA